MASQFAFAALLALSFVSPAWSYSAHDHPSRRSHSDFHCPIPDIPRTNLSNSTFQQLIDHNNPGLGTFSQFYYYSDEWWTGPGAPVVLFTPGEVNVTGYNSYLTNRTTTGVIAQTIGGTAVVLEHRYWGMSSPYAELTTENLQYLTLQNSILDLTYFAEHVRLPFDPHGTSRASRAPWVLSGGSYSGALTAWTESVAPGVIWAYQASSAVVEAIGNYWEYFVPIQEGMPQNCSKDVTLVVDYIDQIGFNGTAEQQQAVKAMFGFADLEHYDDFAEALVNGPYQWQGNQFYYNSGFFAFCDAVEGVTHNSTVIPGAEGVGLQKALAGYANWTNNTLIPGYCESFKYFNGTRNVECFDTYNASSPLYTDISLSNTYDRQWDWMLCNEPFGYWQNGAPPDRPTIVSRMIENDYWTRQCAMWFPPENGHTYGLAAGKTYNDVNAYTGGWFIDNSTRLVYANGGYDPWREATVSSDFRPGGPLQSTPKVPVYVVPGGYHTSDLLTRNGAVNPGCQAVITAEVQQVKEWVAQYPRRGHWDS